MQIGDEVIYQGRVLLLLGHEPMSVPNRRAQVRDPETGEVLEVAYDELDLASPEPPGFDSAA